MGVLRFDGSTNRVRFTSLASALANVGDGGWTMAVLLRRASTGTWDGLSYLLDAGGTTNEAGASIMGGAPVTNAVMCDTLRGGTANATTTFTSTTDTIILAVSKASGTATPRVGSKNVTSGAAWAHQAMNTTITNGNAAAQLGVGAWQGTDFLDGWIGLVAWWEGDMSDAQKEELSTNLRTSDWWAPSFGAPAFLCEFNVAAASLVDLAGNATGLTTFGSFTLDGAVTLESWNFDGTGAPAATYPTAKEIGKRSAFPFMPMAARKAGTPTGRFSNAIENTGPAPYGGFERSMFPRLHQVVVSGTTYFGASSLDLTDTVTTAATRTTFGVVAVNEVVSEATVGTLNARGVVAVNLVAGVTTVGRLTARAAAAVALVVGAVTAGTRKALAASSLALSVSAATVARVNARGAVSVAEVVDVTTQGSGGAVSASANTRCLLGIGI